MAFKKYTSIILLLMCVYMHIYNMYKIYITYMKWTFLLLWNVLPILYHSGLYEIPKCLKIN